MRRLLILSSLLLLAPSVWAQSSRFQSQVINSRGIPLANQNVAVCTQPANISTTPCSTLATLATSTITTSGGINPTTTDINGNFFFYAVPGTYTIQIYGPAIATPFVQPDVSVGASGAASLTSLTVSGTATLTGAMTTTQFNKTLYLDGVTYPQTCAGLTSMITAGGSNSHFVIPPNLTLSCSTTTFLSNLNNVLLEGGGDSTLIQLTGSSAINALNIAGSGPGTSANLASNSAEGSNTITLTAGGAAAIGAAAGAYYLLTDSAAIVNSQVGRITSVAGDVITSDEQIFVAGGFTTANTAKMQILAVSNGIRVRNLKIDATGNSNVNTNGIVLTSCVNCEVSQINLTGMQGAGVYATYGHNNNIHELMMFNCGNTGAACLYLIQQTHDTAHDVQVEHLPSSSFGYTFTQTQDSAFSDLLLNHTQSGGGRGFKLFNSSYNLFTNISVEAVATGFNGVSIESHSNHNRFTNVQSNDNQGAGIVTFGTVNTYNTFVNCSAKFNTNNQLQIGTTDVHNTVIGGEFANARGTQALVTVAASDTVIMGAKIWDDNGQATGGGLAFGAGADKGVYVGNTFSGLGAALDIVDSNVTNSTFIGNQVPDGVTRTLAINTNMWFQNIGDSKPSNADRVGQVGTIWAESTAPNPTGAGTDTCYGDSTYHGIKCAYNNGTASGVPLVGIANTWTAAQTIGTGGSLAATSLLISPTAPTIAGAGCGGTVAAIQNANGTSSFDIFTGTAPTSGGCTITMPAAAHHWHCEANHTSAISTTNFIIQQTDNGASTTSVTLQLFSDVAAATAPAASDTWRTTCTAN